MKTTGIIAEYNPFHNGHYYQFEQIRSQSGSDYIIVIMSGDFVQRGEPAIYDKYTRTQAALTAGADLVIELPAAFATASAEDFAAGAIALLDQLNIADEVCFGSECGDTGTLSLLAGILIEEPADYQHTLRQGLKSGSTYPQARNLALLSWLEKHPVCDLSPETAGQVLTAPNNILGIEYIKALKHRHSRIHPVTITRSGRGYHDLEMTQGFASASGIRTAIRLSIDNKAAKLPAAVLDQVPATVYSSYQTATPIFADDLSVLLNQVLLRTGAEDPTSFSEYSDLSAEMAARLQNHLLDFTSFSGRIEQLKTRQYTYTRISRALLHLILDLRTADLEQYRALDYTPYARILGFRKQSAPLLAELKKHSSIPLISKTANAESILSQDAYKMFQKDLYCSHLYQMLLQQKSGEVPRNEYTRSVIII